MGSEIEQIAGQIVAHPRYQRLRNFEHHGPGNSIYDHSIAVAEMAYAIARRLRLTGDETASVVRAALLHDFLATIGTATVSGASSAGIPAGSASCVCTALSMATLPLTVPHVPSA